MKTSMTFKHMDATQAIKEHVEEQSAKIRKFVGESTECIWVFVVEAGQHIAELHVKGPHVDSFARAKTDDLYVSIDNVIDKVEVQLRRQKEMTKNHLHR